MKPCECKKQAEDTSAGTLSAFKTLASGLSALGFGAMIKNAIILAGDLQQNIGGSESVFKIMPTQFREPQKLPLLRLDFHKANILQLLQRWVRSFRARAFR